jgi:hypothetical protein
MDSLQVALIVLVAVFVGATVPALIQLQITLRHLGRSLDRASHGFERVMNEVNEVAMRVNRVSASLEPGVTDLRDLLESVGGLAETIYTTKKALGVASTIGAAVAPAVGAAVAAMRRENGATEHGLAFGMTPAAERGASAAQNEAPPA